MPQARKGRTKKDADAGATTTRQRRAKAKQAEAEAEDDEDEEEEDEAPASTRRKITEEIAQTAADMRADGATWQEIIDETGFNGAQLRPHIARLTEQKIDTLEDTAESVAEHREEGYAWYAMAVSLGKTVAEVKEMAEEGGADIEGRVYRSNGAAEAEDEEQEEAEEQEEEAPKPKRGRAKAGTATKAKPAAAKTSTKTSSAGSRRRKKANPSEED
jgi:hypothetical protein